MTFIRHDKFANKYWKGIISNKNRFADKDLSSWTGLGGPDMTEVRLLVKFRTFQIPTLIFEVISKSFCMVLHGGAQETRFLDQKR